MGLLDSKYKCYESNVVQGDLFYLNSLSTVNMINSVLIYKHNKVKEGGIRIVRSRDTNIDINQMKVRIKKNKKTSYKIDIWSISPKACNIVIPSIQSKTKYKQWRI